MSWRNILAIARKDLIDALKDARILVSLLVPIGLGLLYNSIFPEEGLSTPRLAYHAVDSPAILEGIRANAGSTVDLRVREVADEAEARRLMADGQVDVAVIVAPGTETSIRQGQATTILLIGKDPPDGAELFMTRALDQTVRQIAGQRPPASLRVDRVRTGIADTEALGELGPRRFFVLATMVMLMAMIGLLAVPVMLTEEMEKKTLDALLLIVRQEEVIAAKSAVGLVYVLVGVPLMFVLTRLEARDPAMLIAATLLTSAVLVGLGLLTAGVLRNATRVYTWSSLFVMIAFIPAIAVGLPVPQWADAIIRTLPTAQGMRLLTDGVAGRPLFGDAWIGYLVLAVWTVATFALLRWQLGRREA